MAAPCGLEMARATEQTSLWAFAISNLGPGTAWALRGPVAAPGQGAPSIAEFLKRPSDGSEDEIRPRKPASVPGHRRFSWAMPPFPGVPLRACRPSLPLPTPTAAATTFRSAARCPSANRAESCRLADRVAPIREAEEQVMGCQPRAGERAQKPWLGPGSTVGSTLHVRQR